MKEQHPLKQLTLESLVFPPIEQALDEPNGLLAFGGDLSVKRLYNAYKSGIFPWYSEEDPIMWWSPNPRAIINTSTIRVNKTLRKVINRNTFRVTLNTAFEDVINFCSNAPFRKEGTWIVKDMLNAYIALHNEGYAHSIEVWEGDKLVGGLYGVAINGYFSGESMFYITNNASKVALASLAEHLQKLQISMIDCQLLNPFLEDMGCFEISRDEFKVHQINHVALTIPNNFWYPQILR